MSATSTQSKTWTLAEIKEANTRAGFYFFSRNTMKFFGDTMRSFRVFHNAGRVFIRRVRPMRDYAGRDMGGLGDVREFHPETGDIGQSVPRGEFVTHSACLCISVSHRYDCPWHRNDE